MKTLKHTSGEWSYRQKRGNNIYEHQIMANNRIIIAELDGKDFEIKGSDDIEKSSEIKANAKLIAAAPELLDVLKRMTDYLQGMDSNGNVVIRIPLSLSEEIGNVISKAIL